MPTPEDAQLTTTFTEALTIADALVEQLCRRHRMRRQDAEDFSSYVRLKLLENDYKILRRFAGRSRLRTYLLVVIQRLLLDYRTETWGKYRPSSQAKRLGAVALWLERLTCRDGFEVEEAVAILRTNMGVRCSHGELLDLAARLPRRSPRRFEELQDAAVDGKVEDRVRERERLAAARLANDVLSGALQNLPREDRLIVKMRFVSGFTVREIAAALDLPQRRVFTRIAKCLKHLRLGVEQKGVTRELVASLIGWQGYDLSVDFLSSADPTLGGHARE